MGCLLAREHTTDMTERKPPGVSWESWFEEQIRRAREDGAFDNLPGAGKPLPDLEGGYDPDWWVKKLVQRERVSVLPPPLELLRKIESEIKKIWALSSEADVRAAQVLSLNAEIARSNARAAEGPPTRLGLLDPDAIVAQWRTNSTGSRK
jgi:DnaJ homologue, subfamily C, member 28, conserved domain